MDVHRALAAGEDDVVTVNQRALIDKILARYPGEYTVFRELLQNADDANAKRVEIYFQTPNFKLSSHDKSEAPVGTADLGNTNPELPDLTTAIINKWIVKNDGRPFETDDWNRLKKIAEGNPDEDKIGAYVRFYSLFSVTETPLVASGDKYMVFYWKDGKDQLHVRTGVHQSGPSAGWTSIQMDLRDPGSLPGRPVDMARFFCTSLTFTNSISEISLYFDEHRLFKLSKVLSPPKSHALPPYLKARSPRSFMLVKGVRSTNVAVHADVLRWVYNTGFDKPSPLPSAVASEQGFFTSFFTAWKHAKAVRSSPQPPTPNIEEDLMETCVSSIHVQIYSAEIAITLPRKESAEVERATKKKAPSRCLYQIIYTGKEAHDASHPVDSDGSALDSFGIFSGLRGDLEGRNTSRVFIGHSTAQSTGMGGHHASRFIPTVEREAIDFSDPMVSIWNRELLYVGGFLCRAIYELELAAIGEHWNILQLQNEAAAASESRDFLDKKFQHILRFFNFHESTPAPQVSKELQRAFLSSSSDLSLPVLSSAGIKPSEEVRRPDKAFEGFIKGVSTITRGALGSAPNLLDTLPAPIRKIGFDDIIHELESRPLSEQETISCLNWRLDCPHSFFPSNQETMLTRRLLESATLFIAAEKDAPERLIQLSVIQTYLNLKSGIPLNTPLPDHCLPATISKAIKSGRIREVFPWTELTIKMWIAHLVHISTMVDNAPLQSRITQCPTFAELALNVLSKQWSSVSGPDQTDIVNLLKNTTCIPTKLGMKKPDEAYLPNVDMFPDLPIIDVQGSIKGDKLRMLETLGIRKRVELQLIFTREMASGNWSIPKLISYLVSVKEYLTVEELNKLAQTRVFLAVPSERFLDASRRCLARELYVPSDTLRLLGLPILDWQGEKWHSSSREAKFMFSLGLQEKPSAEILLPLAVDGGPHRDAALTYFIQNFYVAYASTYDPEIFASVAFVPSIAPDGSQGFSTPTQVFSESSCSVLGFPVIRPEWKHYSKTHFKLRDSPSSEQVLVALRSAPPHSQAEGRLIFEYLSTVVSNFSPYQRHQLGDYPVVPYLDGDQALRHLRPSECFVGQPDRKVLSRIFQFVDFGDIANKFLQLCGTQKFPTAAQIAAKLLDDPVLFHSYCGGVEQYMDELRRLGLEINNLDRLIRRRLASEKCLMGSRPSRSSSPKLDESDDETEGGLEYSLVQSSELVIVDDNAAYRLFREFPVWAAPQDDIIEAMYKELGVSLLSASVKEEMNAVGGGVKSTRAQEIRNLVLERLPLFLHDQKGPSLVIKFDWLKQSLNFQVEPVRLLKIKGTLSLSGSAYQKVRTASAGAKRPKNGPVILYLADNVELDYYELAHALCRTLLRQHRINDSMLFMTVLSTELRALKRRGYNVDRILKQQRPILEKGLQEGSNSIVSRGPVRPGASPDQIAPERAAGNTTPTVEHPNKSVFSHLKNKMKELQIGSSSGSKPWPAHAQAANQTQTPQKFVTPTQDIERNVSLAISACRQEHSSIIQSREQMSQIKEVDAGGAYCDISHATNLEVVDTWNGFKIYVERDIPESHQLVESKSETIRRFGEVIGPLLQDVYKIPLRSISLFYDSSGPTIAFNRGGSIFLNVRYFEAWHDAMVIEGIKREPRIAWYFILAHEIAHNLVQLHNAEHEFYFAALCEHHLVALCSHI
ncbi:uncharacterized protein EI90DRAFT_2978708 [Cantharellus anzutake]|uniref:uncharacterized protein n=1 Tax=Cantharellus anzutake TaxID=1750568 RepID=UPI00190513C0|nr:uncharacterized protein EI90DRAFT_2978708 [Cantharellus anzutake]KAF8318815.1 hypothetical protein EI90DRAFT_2978708 [Cantharellus anzutake]